MRVLSGLDHVRRNPERFLRGVPPNGAELAEKLAGDLLLLGGSRVLLLQVSDWFGVASDMQWLPTDDTTRLKHAFENMRPFPESGVNSIHSEILLGAFATSVVVVVGAGKPAQVIGTSPAPGDALPAWVAQTVWFQVDNPRS